MNNSVALKYLFALLTLGSLSFSPVKAQDTSNAIIDSLRMMLMNDEKNPAKVDVYTSLSKEYMSLDHAWSFEYSELGLAMAEEIDYEKGVLESQLALAHLYRAYMLDYTEAKKYYELALVHAQTLNDTEAEMKVYRGMSYIYGAINDYEMARSYNEKAMVIAKTLDDYSHTADLNSFMGELLEVSGDTAGAIDYYKQVLKIEKKNNFRNTTNRSRMAVARYYLLTDDYDNALKYYRIALRDFERMNDFRWESLTHAEMANLSIIQNDLGRAEQHGLKGLEIAETNKLKKELGDNYLALVKVYTAMDSTSKADQYQSLYDSLQESLEPIEGTMQVSVLPGETKAAGASGEKMNGFLQALIIMIPVALLIVFAGMPSKKKQ